MTIEFWHPRLGVKTWSEERYEAYMQAGDIMRIARAKIVKVAEAMYKVSTDPSQTLDYYRLSPLDKRAYERMAKAAIEKWVEITAKP